MRAKIVTGVMALALMVLALNGAVTVEAQEVATTATATTGILAGILGDVGGATFISAVLSLISTLCSPLIGILNMLLTASVVLFQGSLRALYNIVVGGGTMGLIFLSDVIFTVWEFIGLALVEIWFIIKLVVGGVLGIFGSILNFIPIVSLFISLGAGILYGIWLAIYLIIGIVGWLLPMGLRSLVAELIGDFAGVTGYPVAVGLIDWIASIIAFLGMFTADSVFGAGWSVAAPLCGGANLVATYVGGICITGLAQTCIVMPVIAIISLAGFIVRTFEAFPQSLLYCANILCGV